MGMDRGSRTGRSGGGGGQNGYQRGYGNRSGYERDSDNSYAEHGSSGGGYDQGGKYDQGGSYSEARNGSRAQRGEEHAAAGEGRHNGQAANDQMLPAALIASLEEKIVAAHSDMSQALQEITGKENEKFDLIFGILIELQRRQATLEESMRVLKSQLPPPVGGQQGQPAPQIHNGQQAGGSRGPQNFMPQMNGQQTNGQMFMPNQVNMGQQYGNMVAADGSQAFMVPANMQQMPGNVVMIAAPQQMQQGMQQMSYAMPQMMSGPMQPQMAMQFVSQEQSGSNFQQPWNGETAQSQQAPGTARSDGAQAASEPAADKAEETSAPAEEPAAAMAEEE